MDTKIGLNIQRIYELLVEVKVTLPGNFSLIPAELQQVAAFRLLLVLQVLLIRHLQMNDFSLEPHAWSLSSLTRNNFSFSFRARYLKHTTWQPCGNCLVFSSVRTIGMGWELRLKGLQPVRTTTKEETSFQGSGWVQLQFVLRCAGTCSKCISQYIYKYS